MLFSVDTTTRIFSVSTARRLVESDLFSDGFESGGTSAWSATVGD